MTQTGRKEREEIERERESKKEIRIMREEVKPMSNKDLFKLYKKFSFNLIF